MVEILKAMYETIDLSTTYSGTVFYIGNASKLAMQAVSSNNLCDGTIEIQGSIDGDNFTAISYEDENGDLQTSYTVASGTAINHIWETDTAIPYVKLVWNRTAGPSQDTTIYYSLKNR